ncbi:MAG: polysaccharide biosynthesis C-terminal domain-containing protein, partial [Mollicutes bacterium PWAP]|nr:polysaccharide biosynthesis C-terminal domain-containing protein [Mollicutes bacterium PWAP]
MKTNNKTKYKKLNFDEKINQTFNNKWYEKSFFKMSMFLLLPVIFGSILNVTVSFVDTFAITHYGKQSENLTSVSTGGEIFFILQSIVLGISSLFSIFYAQYYAARKKEKFKEVFKLNIIITVTLIILGSLILFLFSDPLTSLFIHKGDVADDGGLFSIAYQNSITYLKIMSLSYIFFAIGTLLVFPLIMMGKTKYQLYLSLISLIINIILDIIFIYVLDLGVEGCAWATVVSFIIQSILALWLLIKNKEWMFIDWRIFNITKDLLKMSAKRSIFIIGNTTFSISLVILTILSSDVYGSDIIKVLGVCYSIAGIFYTAFDAVKNGVRIIIGYSLGKSEFSKAQLFAKKLSFTILFIVFLFSIFGVALAFGMPWLLLNKKQDIWNSIYLISIFAVTLIFEIFYIYWFSIQEVGGQIIWSMIFNHFVYIWIIVPFYVLSIYFFKTSFINASIIRSLWSIPIMFISFYTFKKNKWLKTI